jgi:galactokinase
LSPQTEEEWVNYVLGVVDQLKAQGVQIGGARLGITSTIPIGAGLSSSAALEIATALTFKKLYPFEMDDLDLARVGQGAEHTFAGVKCGLLDQISVLMSRPNQVTTIDCRTFDIGHVDVPAGYAFVIAHSGVKHALTGGEYNERRESCEKAAQLCGVPALRDLDMDTLEAKKGDLPGLAFKRAKHVVGENERVARGTDLLKAGDAEGFGRLMFESHDSSREWFENSCEELDFLVETARGLPGCRGARLSGGGFGGATINLVDEAQSHAFSEALGAAYQQRYGERPLVLETLACAGAR